jgi:hypothetical protein
MAKSLKVDLGTVNFGETVKRLHCNTSRYIEHIANTSARGQAGAGQRKWGD